MRLSRPLDVASQAKAGIVNRVLGKVIYRVGFLIIMVWQRTISLKALQKAKGTSVKIGNDIVFIASLDGKLFAMDGVCSHAKCILGGLEPGNMRVRCFCHDAEYDLATGKMMAPPFVAPNAPMDKLGLRTYPIREESGFIEVEV